MRTRSASPTRASAAGQPLLRIPSTGVLGGVCSGIAHRLGWEPSLLRLAWIVLTILSAIGPGVLVYSVLWLVVPAGPEPYPQLDTAAVPLESRTTPYRTAA